MLLIRKKRPTLVLFVASLLCLATAMPPVALGLQDQGSQGQGSQGPDHPHDGPPMEHSSHEGHGRWWDNPHVAQKIGLTDVQKQQMDAIFEQHRSQLKDLYDTLKTDEATLHPLLQADKLDEHRVLHQIDVIAQARANLEKANARMLFDLRKVLTPEQWKKLQEMAREWHSKDHHGQHDSKDGHPGPPPGPPNQ
ncbi:MAG: Spy/CpxP family protein refolding chaperone [Acidobacteriaceae bacterium]